MRNSATIVRRIMPMVAVGMMSLALIAPADGQDRMVLGPDQFKDDKSGMRRREPLGRSIARTKTLLDFAAYSIRRKFSRA
jgi:hypothetical protein